MDDFEQTSPSTATSSAAPPMVAVGPPPGSAAALAQVIGPQLTQVRVPLEDVAAAFSTADEAGRYPVVVIPQQIARISNGPVIAGVVLLGIAVVFNIDLALRATVVGVGALLVALGIFRSFIVPVPMGSQAVLLRRGRFHRTAGPGTRIVPPWIPVSHIVATREIPFDAPAMSIPTRDDVRVNIDIVMTFTIAAPENFVFTITAPDFDQVVLATCQQSLRELIREKDWGEVLDMKDEDHDRLRSDIASTLDRYGVEVVRVVITHIMLPLDFVASRESRRLAAVQLAEEQEQHSLEQQRLAAREDLARQRIAAQREQIELQAANEVTRLERLQKRLGDFPDAMRWDVESQRLEVARALAANTRAMVQVGPGGDVARSLLMHTLDDGVPSTPVAPTRKSDRK